jgi:hypothetical protein
MNDQQHDADNLPDSYNMLNLVFPFSEFFRHRGFLSTAQVRQELRFRLESYLSTVKDNSSIEQI